MIGPVHGGYQGIVGVKWECGLPGRWYLCVAYVELGLGLFFNMFISVGLMLNVYLCFLCGFVLFYVGPLCGG